LSELDDIRIFKELINTEFKILEEMNTKSIKNEIALEKILNQSVTIKDFDLKENLYSEGNLFQSLIKKYEEILNSYCIRRLLIRDQKYLSEAEAEKLTLLNLFLEGVPSEEDVDKILETLKS